MDQLHGAQRQRRRRRSRSGLAQAGALAAGHLLLTLQHLLWAQLHLLWAQLQLLWAQLQLLLGCEHAPVSDAAAAGSSRVPAQSEAQTTAAPAAPGAAGEALIGLGALLLRWEGACVRREGGKSNA